MPEIPNVVSNEIVASVWGNQIRDRTIQRYATTTERGTEHPLPADGDLSFIESTGVIEVYFSGAWRALATNNEVDNHAAFSGTTTTTITDIGSVSLTIPANWGSWKCYASLSCAVFGAAGTGSLNIQIRIDGTDTTLVDNLAAASSPLASPVALVARRTGMTTTGARTVAVRASHDSPNPAITIRDGNLYARAVRTA